MLAPSRAARNAMASPMPREAPVMNRVFPANDTSASLSLLARQKRREGSACLLGLQTFLEMHGLGIDSPRQLVKIATHQFAGERDCAGRQGGDFARSLKDRRIQNRRIDNGIDQTGSLAFFRRHGAPH